MKVALEILSLIIKLLVVALGAMTAADASVLHLSMGGLGGTIAGLGTAATVVKVLQVSAAKKEEADKK